MKLNFVVAILTVAIMTACDKTKTPSGISEIGTELVTVQSIEIPAHKETLPKLVDRGIPDNPAVKKINEAIWIDRLMMESFEAEQSRIPWGFDTVNYKIQDETFYFSFTGFYGANEHSAEMLFDLKTGDQIELVSIPFHHLFDKAKYADFLNLYWMEKADAAFEKAIQCAMGGEPYCKKWDIDQYEVVGSQFIFSLTSDCYPSAASSCNPKVEISEVINGIDPMYFSDLGTKVLLPKDNFTQKSILEKNLWAKQNQELIAAASWSLDDFEFSVENQAEEVLAGLILPEKDSYQAGQPGYLLPASGLIVYNNQGKKAGRIIGSSEGGHFGPITSVSLIIGDMESGIQKEIGVFSVEEIAYELSAFVFMGRQNGMLELSGFEESYWVKEEDLATGEFSPVGWQQFLVDNNGRLMGYYAKKETIMELKVEPNDASDVLMSVTSDLNEINPTGEIKGRWMRVEVNVFDEHPCDGGSTLSAKEGWMKLTDENGERLVNFYSRGC